MCMMQLRSQGGDLLLPESLTSRYPARASYSSPRRPRPSIRSVHSPVRKVFPIALSEERPTLIPFCLVNLYSLVLANSFSVGFQVNCSQSILHRTNWYLGPFYCSSPAAIVRLLVPFDTRAVLTLDGFR
jgi:hypothetical protein